MIAVAVIRISCDLNCDARAVRTFFKHAIFELDAKHVPTTYYIMGTFLRQAISTIIYSMFGDISELLWCYRKLEGIYKCLRRSIYTRSYRQNNVILDQNVWGAV